MRPFDGARADLLRAASHRMRTPVTSIVGYLELLLDGSMGPLTDDQEDVLRTVARNVSQLSAQIDALEPGALDAGSSDPDTSARGSSHSGATESDDPGPSAGPA